MRGRCCPITLSDSVKLGHLPRLDLRNSFDGVHHLYQAKREGSNVTAFHFRHLALVASVALKLSGNVIP